MPDFLNHAAIAAPRNGTTSHSVSPATTNVGTTNLTTGVVAGALVAGTLFTPTAGRFLLCVSGGSVTSTTPTLWTQPTNYSAVNNGGLYVWYTASVMAGTTDSVTTTHNGSNYPCVFDFYEFAASTTWVGAQSAINVAAAGGAGPSLTGLTGLNWTAGAVNQSDLFNTVGSVTWISGTEQVDANAVSAATDGYTYSLTSVADNAATSASYAATVTGAGTTSVERLVFAVKTPAATTATRFRTVGKRR